MPLAFAFAAIAGYADAIGYLRYKAFAGMMTGNTVLMGIAFFHQADLPVGDYAAVLAIFLVTSIVAFAALRTRWLGIVMVILETIALLLPDFIPGWWAVVLLVIAMALQNPLAQRLGLKLGTTFISGDLLRFSQGVAGRLVRRSGQKTDEAFAIYGTTWLGYAIGAAFGAAAFTNLSAPLVVPAAALLVVYGLARVATSYQHLVCDAPNTIKL